MRVLLDECVPRRLARLFPYQVSTVQELRLSGLDNGELLKAIEEDFDVFVTVDQNLQYQQNLRNTRIAILVLVASSNRYDDLKPVIPACVGTRRNQAWGSIKYQDKAVSIDLEFQFILLFLAHISKI